MILQAALPFEEVSSTTLAEHSVSAVEVAEQFSLSSSSYHLHLYHFAIHH